MLWTTQNLGGVFLAWRKRRGRRPAAQIGLDEPGFQRRVALRDDRLVLNGRLGRRRSFVSAARGHGAGRGARVRPLVHRGEPRRNRRGLAGRLGRRLVPGRTPRLDKRIKAKASQCDRQADRRARERRASREKSDSRHDGSQAREPTRGVRSCLTRPPPGRSDFSVRSKTYRQSIYPVFSVGAPGPWNRKRSRSRFQAHPVAAKSPRRRQDQDLRRRDEPQAADYGRNSLMNFSFRRGRAPIKAPARSVVSRSVAGFAAAIGAIQPRASLPR